MCNMFTTVLNITTLKGPLLRRYSTVDPRPPGNFSEGVMFPDIRFPILDTILTYKNNYTSIFGNPDADNSNRTFESIFYYCIQEFSTKVRSGTADISFKEIDSLTTNKTMTATGYTDAEELTLTPEDDSDEDSYKVTAGASFSTAVSLWRLFQGGVTNAGIINPKTEAGRVLGQVVDLSRGSVQLKPNNYELIPGIMENIAISLSNK